MADAAVYFDNRESRQKKYREATLRRLNRDSEFVLRTELVKQGLIEIRKTSPTIFRKFFRRFTPLILLSRNQVRKLLKGVVDREARKVFRAYVRYASRFKVRMVMTARTFRPQPFDPPECKYRAKIVDGHLRVVGKEHPKEPIYELLFLDEGMAVPPDLEALIERGRAKFFRVDDSQGGSLLNEIEFLAYQPSGLTFIVHYTPRPRIYLLIGENLSTDELLRSAGKVVTALQKTLFKRKKVGRPANLTRLRAALLVSRQPKDPKDRAFLIARETGRATDLETAGRYLRRVKARVMAIRSK